MILHPSLGSFHGMAKDHLSWSRALIELEAFMDGGGGGGIPALHDYEHPFHPFYEAFIGSAPASFSPSSSSSSTSSASSAPFYPVPPRRKEEEEEEEEEEEGGLDPGIWSRLPETIIERVLASVPPLIFFRLRIVCKKWYSLLFSDSFLELCGAVNHRRHLCSSSSSRRSWFLVFNPSESKEGGGGYGEVFAFNPDSEPELDPQRGWRRLADFSSFVPAGFAPAGSAGGLVCCVSDTKGPKTVLVCNPLTRTCAQLPPTLKPRFLPTLGLLADHHHPRGSYQIVAAGDDLISPFAVKNLTAEVYDSVTRSWRVSPSPLPRLCSLDSGKATFVGRTLYAMNYSPFSILAYDENLATWAKIQAPMRRFLRYPSLVECQGQLVLVAAVEKNKLNVPRSIRIWGLRNGGWVELERMPHALYEEFMEVSQDKAFACAGHGDLLLVTLSQGPRMLLYDFRCKVWRWLPKCPYLGPNVHGLQAFPFDPRLEASVC